MLGWSKNQRRKANFWQMSGVYALYMNNDLIYVGQASVENLGDRLKHHNTKDELRHRWNSFSWYGTRSVGKTRDTMGLYRLLSPKKHGTASTKNLIDVLETLAIRIIDPPMNRQREKIHAGGETSRTL